MLSLVLPLYLVNWCDNRHVTLDAIEVDLGQIIKYCIAVVQSAQLAVTFPSNAIESRDVGYNESGIDDVPSHRPIRLDRNTESLQPILYTDTHKVYSQTAEVYSIQYNRSI